MKLGTIYGIRLIINDYFLLLLLGYALLGVLGQVLIIFGLVLYHETAHVLAARRYGIKVREVELLPFGGVARLEQMLEAKPSVEIRVALAGPLSNFFLFLISLLLFPQIANSPWGKLFLQANLTLAFFNLLPAFPLDGGRIFRSLAAGRIGLSQATFLAVRWGKRIAVGIGLLGLAGLYWRINDINPLILAIFLYGVSCREEADFHYLFLRYLLRKREELPGVLPGIYSPENRHLWRSGYEICSRPLSFSSGSGGTGGAGHFDRTPDYQRLIGAREGISYR